MSHQIMTAAGVPFPARNSVRPVRALPPIPKSWTSLGSAFLHAVRAHPEKLYCRDSLGESLTYRETARRAGALAGVLSRKCDPGEALGLMVPTVAAGAVANIATTLLGKWAVNVNYAGGDAAVNSAIKQCRIRTLVTTGKLIEKTGIKPECDRILLLEDLRKEVSWTDKALGLACGSFVPLPVLSRFLPGLRRTRDDVAAVMFSSGSEGDPKGVMLSHGNLLYNFAQVDSHGRLEANDKLMGMLPFFHVFGYGLTLWAMACLGRTSVFHLNPQDPRTIAKLVAEEACSLMACTPTLMRGYLRRCTREQFATMRWLLLGSEKLKPELAEEISRTLGVLPVEGYGCTECPVVCGNVPRDIVSLDGATTVFGNRPGSVGQPVPGTAVAIVDMDSGELVPPGSGREGLIFVSGPQVMLGYVNRPELTEQVLQNGFYCTGDIGYMDRDGFVFITDRWSRFAKVAGEMVPLNKVEGTIRKVLGVTDELAFSLTAVPDEQRGERLVVVFTPEFRYSAAEVVAQLNQTDLPKLWLPKPSDFVCVDSLPVTATGKLDLKGVKKLAQSKVG